MASGRVRATRWPDAPEDAGWSLGTDLDYLGDLVEYWIDGFDWRAQENAIAPRQNRTVLYEDEILTLITTSRPSSSPSCTPPS
jgi:hypothetical protein